jgi:MFS family permease
MSADGESKLSARFFLGLVALFLGELRDGLTMINMQSAFLIVSKYYTEKQAGILFFVFGMSQFLFQAPAGYIMDYTNRKVGWLAFASVATTSLTILTAATAKEYGANLGLMIFIKFIQGGVTALIPPGLNSITQGIVGSDGMTRQVSDNEMRNHFGTAIIVLTGSLMAFFMYPDIGMLFLVSPVACAGVIFFLFKINPKDIDHDAARGLKGHEHNNNHSDSIPDLYNLTNTDGTPKQQQQQQQQQTPKNKYGWGRFGTPSGPIGNPSFNFDGGSGDTSTPHVDGASSPLALLKDMTLLTFIIIVFLFHTSNGTVLPLVMQTLAIGEGRIGILMSGLCIIVAQIFMVGSAKICGDYSGLWGRKTIFLVGLFSVPIRCLILYILTGIKNGQEETSVFLQVIILSTQILDGVGAGVFGTMYILVTSDISAGTGRFSLTLGLTSAAMSIGGTVSGYLGQAIAQDLGYQNAFMILGVMACVPAAGYLVFMPETLNGGKGATEGGMSVITEEEGRAENEKAVVV